MSRPFVLNVAELLRRPGTERDVVLEATPDELGLDDPRLDDAPVTARLRLNVLTDGIVVDGAIEAAWRDECRRCLTPVGGQLHVDVQELYQVMLTDPDAFALANDQLDLRPMVREAVLLQLADAPLCRPDCAGLCPVCGTNRNEQPCSCEPAPADERWAALDVLREQLGR
jgi:uncharacterized protein